MRSFACQQNLVMHAVTLLLSRQLLPALELELELVLVLVLVLVLMPLPLLLHRRLPLQGAEPH
eukprot:COSAG02_NODE_131_length_34710_cov_17.171159_29_plen_63_part_00